MFWEFYNDASYLLPNLVCDRTQQEHPHLCKEDRGMTTGHYCINVFVVNM